MSQLALFVPKPAPAAAAAAAAATCPRCGGKVRRGRCHPCQKDTPPIGGAAWKRWVRGISRAAWARLRAAGLDDHGLATLLAVLGDDPVPAETAALVADLLALPCSPGRYRRRIEVAELRSRLGHHLASQGLRATEADPHAIDNVAGRAAALIWAQRDRVSRGEVFERQHDAELVEQAVREHQAREELRARGFRGQKLEAAVAARVAREMVAIRGSYGRPTDEYPRDVRIRVEGLRLEAPTARVVDVDVAAEEAAEVEAGARRVR